MRRMKQAFALTLSLSMCATMLAGCGKEKETPTTKDNPTATTAPTSGTGGTGTETPSTPVISEDVGSTGGKTLRIYCWNDEFQVRFNKYYADKLPEGVTVDWVINANQNNVYQTKLDEALLKQESAAKEDRIDIFLIEADYATKYIATPYTLDIVNEVGITTEQLADQYQYTKDVVTSDGVLKGVSWQACPQGFLYRRSMAKAVLGTDDPDQVQAYVADWATFDKTAAKMKEAGYFMLSGYDDDYRVFANNAEKPWVDENYKIQIDDNITQWIDQTKTYTDLGYNNKGSLWSAESTAQMAKDGKVFGYFGPAWFMDFCFMDYTLTDPEAEKEVGNGGYGDWAMTKGPQGSYWGGTWICAAKGTDNIDIVKDVLLTMTTDKETLTGITNTFGDFTNSVSAMTEIANSDYGYAFLGGQNHIKVLLESAQDIQITVASPYDQTMTEKLQQSMKDYFEGVVTLDQAWDNFYKTVLSVHPELSR